MKNFLKLFVLLSVMLSLSTAVNLTKAIAKKKSVCTLEPSYGSCNGRKVKWYYDFVRDRCIEFSYSTCGGNENRFNSRIACINYCMNPANLYVMQDFENEHFNFRKNEK